MNLGDRLARLTALLISGLEDFKLETTLTTLNVSAISANVKTI